jgi:translation initiation factor IF-1
MKLLPVLLSASLLAGCASHVQSQSMHAPARQDAPQARATPVDPALAGEYSLGGVMETGSGLLLRNDGSFEWYFSYGALDLGARGTWTRTGDVVELLVKDMGYPPQFPQGKFERMQLRIDDGDLVPAWPWDMDGFRKGGERGRYARH